MMDGQIPRLIRNFSWLALAEVGMRLIGLVIAIYLARVLGASLYGAVGLSMAVIGVLEIVVRAGTGPRAMRQVALQPGSIPEVYSEVVGLRITMACSLITMVYLIAPSMSAALSIPADLLVLYSLTLLGPALTTAWAFRGLERMHIVALGTTVRRLLVLLGVLFLVRDGAADLLRVPMIELAATLCMVSWYWMTLRREHAPLSVRFTFTKWPAILREALPVSLGTLLGLVYVHGDVLMLGWLADSAAAGQFLVAHMIVLTFAILFHMLNTAAFPATARLMAHDPAQGLGLHADLFRCTMVVIAPVVVYGAFYSHEIIGMLFGDDYAQASTVLTILLMTLPMVALTQSLRTLLLTLARSGHLMIGEGAGALVHIILAVILIPRSGIMGAALACLTGAAVTMLTLLILVRTVANGIPLRYRSFAPVAAGASLAIVLVSIVPMSAAMGLVLSALVFLVVVWSLNGVNRNDLEVVGEYLRSLSNR